MTYLGGEGGQKYNKVGFNKYIHIYLICNTKRINSYISIRIYL
jgi:hypothetical protein